MKRRLLVLIALPLVYTALFGLANRSFAAGGDAVTDPEKGGPDFAAQGEYVGEVKGKEGNVKVGVQVIAQGDGAFHAVGYHGGLPGDGWDGKDKHEAEGKREGDDVVIKGDHGSLTIRDGVATVADTGGTKIGELKKVIRKSPTLGAEPPAGAVILFGKDKDGNLVNDFPKDKVGPDGLLTQGITSEKKLQSFTAHIEFLLPFMPAARGQGRGNSGCYFQGRYEVQMLDSFGLKGDNHECGGIYSIADPKLNMCYPPLSWQTYDVDFTAAVYEGDKKVKDATITVKHNGVVIHENVALTHATTAAPIKEGPEPGPLFPQDHGNPVRYRNIWVVEKK